MRGAAMVLAFGLLAGPALAQERIGVRTGDHAGFGRIVFDWGSAPRYRVDQEGDRVLIHFSRMDGIDLAGLRRLPRNLLAVRQAEGAIELTMRPGSRFRHFRNGPKVALDIMDPPGEAAAGSPVTPRPTRRDAGNRTASGIRESEGPIAVATRPSLPPAYSPPAAHVAVAAAPRVDGPPNSASPASAASPPAEIEAPQSAVAAAPGRFTPISARAHSLLDAAPQDPGPPAVAATGPAVSLASPQPIRARPVAAPEQEPGLRFPVGAGVGAAALRRGGQVLLVLDTERPIDLNAARRVAGFADLRAQRLPGATLVSWTSPSDRNVVLRKEEGDWIVAPVPRDEPTATAPLRIQVEGDRAVLAVEQPSRVATVTDPLTGLPLLIGSLSAGLGRQPAHRGLAEFDLLETILGVAVLARADRVVLHPGNGRFLVSIDGGAVALASPGSGEGGEATGMTRSFDMTAQPVSALLDRLRSQQMSVSATAPLLRVEPRFALAQTLLALGLPQEAQAMLRLAVQESPTAAQDGRVQFLAGMAALLASRLTELSGLEAELPSSDEIILWRALSAAIQGEAAVAAVGLSATIPLLLSYPEGLRRRLLPVAAEALAEAGNTAAARRLLQAARDDPLMLLAHALTEEAEGHIDAALEAYAAAGASRDRLTRARALRRGIELRLASGGLDIASAARQLEQTLFAWRGDAQELATRERLATLRRQAGDPRAALALLRETEALFPERAPALRAQTQQAFLEALQADPPLGAVGLYDAHPELLPEGNAGEAMIALLVDRLTALDLHQRASGLLRRALERLPAGEGRAAMGAQLAMLRLGERDAEGALEALSVSSAPRLPAALLQRRSLVAAQAEARRGNPELAVEALRSLGPSGDEAISDILSEIRDFAGAAAALSRHLATQAPTAPATLSEPLQRLAIRNAALLALAGDELGLAALRARHAGQITGPELAPAFEVLTADPVRGLADLPRLARELNLFRSLPQSLEPLRTAQQRAG